MTKSNLHLEVRTIAGGFLLQDQDQVGGWAGEWKVLGATPNEEIKSDLLLAWDICAQLKSNAIAIASGGSTVGLGMGQVNRVEAVEQAIKRWKTHHPLVQSPVLASDAFFPFADSIELIHQAGIKWVIQPGGSVKDEEVFARARDLGVNMVLTGVRHFRH